MTTTTLHSGHRLRCGTQIRIILILCLALSATTITTHTHADDTNSDDSDNQVLEIQSSDPFANLIDGDHLLHLVGSNVPLGELYPILSNNTTQPTNSTLNKKQLRAKLSTSGTDKRDKTFTNPFTKDQMNKFLSEELTELKDQDINITVTRDHNNRRNLIIFGVDGNYEVNEDSHPYYLVGMLVAPGWYCTAQLVGSSYVVLTAASCFENTASWWSGARFIPGYQAQSNGAWTSWGVGYFTEVTYNNEYDYAVFKVQPLTSTWPHGGYLGYYGVSDSYFDTNRAVSLIGYSRNHAGTYSGSNWDTPGGIMKPSRQMRSECSTRGRAQYFIFHDCDALPGAGGAALINSANQVILVHNRAYCGGNDCPDYATTWSTGMTHIGTAAGYFVDVIINSLSWRPNPVQSPTPSPTYSTKSPTFPPTKFRPPNCPSACPTSWLADDWCDSVCNTPLCHLDSGDCRPSNCPTSCPTSWLGDNICDSLCNVAACNLDYGDCTTQSPTFSTPSPTVPTKSPTFPTPSPTFPTNSPTMPTRSPTTKSPTLRPSSLPTRSPSPPTSSPTLDPTNSPTVPTHKPTLKPSDTPSQEPIQQPTLPTQSPTGSSTLPKNIEDATNSPTSPEESIIVPAIAIPAALVVCATAAGVIAWRWKRRPASQAPPPASSNNGRLPSAAPSAPPMIPPSDSNQFQAGSVIERGEDPALAKMALSEV